MTDSNNGTATERDPRSPASTPAPLVSVVIPAYNAAATLEQTLASVFAQTFHDYEIVVVDDGSTDTTAELLASYGDRVRVVTKVNEGKPAAARNRGVQAARGELIAFLDADDSWAPEKLARQVELMQAEPRMGLCYTGAEIIDGHGRRLRLDRCRPDARGDIYGMLSIRNIMIGSSVMARRAAIDEVGGYDESLTSIENWDLWIRIAKDWLVDHVNEPLTSYRKHDGNRSVNVELRRRNIFRILDRHHDPSDRSPEARRRRREAYFNAYFLVLGIGYFGRHEMREARQAFWQAFKLKPSFMVLRHLVLASLGRRGFLALKSVVRLLKGRSPREASS